MTNRKSRIILEDQQNDFLYKDNKSKLDISFNRVSFIFFIFFFIFLIYSIHLVHLGSRKSKLDINNPIKQSVDKLYRADIVDRNGNYLVKTVSSIDIGISTQKVIDQKKLLLNLRYIFPNKDYQKIKHDLKK